MSGNGEAANPAPNNAGSPRNKVRPGAKKAKPDFTATKPDYETGDCYDDDKTIQDARKEWAIEDTREMPYLEYVKKWGFYHPPAPAYYPHLGTLADFMELGTSTARWADVSKMKKEDPGHWKERWNSERERRWSKTSVCRLDFRDGEVPKKTYYTDSSDLKGDLDKDKEDEEAGRNDPQVKLRLYVVEDLSRDVIECLGGRYDIDPAFFREQIYDYAWYNVRDPWRDMPSLVKDRRKQKWTQIRYVTARYFKNRGQFDEAREEAKGWNVLRRPDEDFSNKAFWDTDEDLVALTRSRASFWQRPKKGDTTIGILLLDPTLKAGYPLWRGRRNWQPTPPLQDWDSFDGPTGTSLFEDFIYWCQKPDLFVQQASRGASQQAGGNGHPPATENEAAAPGNSPPAADQQAAAVEGHTTAASGGGCPVADSGQSRSATVNGDGDGSGSGNRNGNGNGNGPRPPAYAHVPVQALLQLICQEWLTVSDYVNTRLQQIEWEIAFPDSLITSKGQDGVDITVPLNKLHTWRRYVPLFREMLAETLDRVFHYPCYGPSLASANDKGGRELELVTTGPHASFYMYNSSPGGPISMYHHDFELINSQMRECQKRIDRVTPVVTAVINFRDMQRANRDAHNLGRLTWLATFFLPFNLIAATFCMQADVTVISLTTVRYFFAAALPLAFVIVLVAYFVSGGWVKRGYRNVLRWHSQSKEKTT